MAQTLAERAAELSGDDPLILAVLGAVHTMLGNLGTARVLLERALALDPFPIVVAAVLLILAPYAHAQHKSAPAGPSETEKAKAQEKRAFEKDTDEAYKAMLGRTPDAKQQKADPWGSMRTAPQK